MYKVANKPSQKFNVWQIVEKELNILQTKIERKTAGHCKIPPDIGKTRKFDDT